MTEPKCSVPDKNHNGLLHEHDVKVSRREQGKIILCEKHEQAYPRRYDPKTGQTFARGKRTFRTCPCRFCIDRRKLMPAPRPAAPETAAKGSGMHLPPVF